MSDAISIEQALASARAAFAPYQDNVRFDEHGAHYRLRLMDNQDRAVVDFDNITQDDAHDADRLNGILASARDQAEARGFSLQPWDSPRTG